MGEKFERLQDWLSRQQLPRGFEMMKDPEWVARFVKGMMESAMSGNPSAGLSGLQDSAAADPEGREKEFQAAISSIEAQWSESRDYLVLKLPMNGDPDWDTLRVMAKEERLKLEGLPGRKPQVLKLPSPILPRSTRAVLKGGMLRIRMKKKPASRYIDISVEEGQE
ncbi:hypothetical protein HGI30_09490 [Paenibacillus albicereus]|uniref:Hsp20/alpha crystallin family protein n=1 Tax=Paenibacillus albicereus TaxID=2726185 RepID=A0A6H2GX61_9BACL|nr:Hsp20/alpha crystallin family protein [Paenibacillus albicereus]QJC51756.1 hypothetical protein HGI30_09490 [Paenibacillus albicereus]